MSSSHVTRVHTSPLRHIVNSELSVHLLYTKDRPSFENCIYGVMGHHTGQGAY